MRSVPAAIEYSRFSVRSSRRPRSAKLATMVSATKPTAMAMSAPAPRVLRLEKVFEAGVSMGSIRLLHVEDDRVGEQPCRDEGGEEHEILEVDDALRDGIEMREERERGD